MRNPNADPRIRVITIIGIRDNGSCQHIRIAEGKSIINDIIIPFSTPFVFKLLVDIRKPVTNHKEKADMLASQVNP